jgi:hypothetical protein
VKKKRASFPDLLFLAGAGLVVAGVYFVYPPAAAIVGGLTLCAVAVAGARLENHKDE